MEKFNSIEEYKNFLEKLKVELNNLPDSISSMDNNIVELRRGDLDIVSFVFNDKDLNKIEDICTKITNKWKGYSGYSRKSKKFVCDKDHVIEAIVIFMNYKYKIMLDDGTILSDVLTDDDKDLVYRLT